MFVNQVEGSVLIWMLVALTVFFRGAKGANQGDNAIEFRVLCRAYQLADLGTRPSNPISLMASKCKEKVQELSFMIEAASSNVTNESIRESENYKEWLRQNHRPPTAGKNDKLGKSLLMVRGRIEKLITKLDDKEQKTQPKMTSIETLFKDARYGTGKEQVEADGTGSFGSSYADACGGTNGQASVGISLVNDMVCLCASSQGSQTLNKCGTGIDGTTSGNQFNNARAGAGVWAKLKLACPDAATQLDRLDEELRHNLRTFETLVGKNLAADDLAAYLLGKVDTVGTGCTGSSALAQSCVNYKDRLGDSKKRNFENIPWVGKLHQVLRHLQDIRREEKEAEDVVQDCNTEVGVARALYHGAFVSSGESPSSREPQQSTKAEVAKGTEAAKDIPTLASSRDLPPRLGPIVVFMATNLIP